MNINKMKTETKLPENHEPYTDKYFLRTNKILKAENLNPWVRAQVFIRKGPGKVYGINETIEILDTYSDLVNHKGKVYALREGSVYRPKETLMIIESPIQDIVELETMYLGVISAETTKANDFHGVDLKKVENNMKEVVKIAEERPVSYFGARHWRFDEDDLIAKAAYNGGATSTSTDIGANTFGQEGVGTIPHALENIMAWKYGYENAVVEATKAFDRVIDKKIPRIALIDYANKEIDDSLAVAKALDDRLYAVRVDTCGENFMQGAIPSNFTEGKILYGETLLNLPTTDFRYWFGRGVSISGVNKLRKELDNGYKNVKIILTSGFGDVEKVKAFIRAEKGLDTRLFDSLGVGGVFKSRMATMDIVAVGKNPYEMIPMSKIGRVFTPNNRLELRLGDKRT